MTESRSSPICARSYDFQLSWYPCSGPPLRRPDHNGPPRHPAGWCMRGHAPRGVLLPWVTLTQAIAERWSPHAQTSIGCGVFFFGETGRGLLPQLFSFPVSCFPARGENAKRFEDKSFSRIAKIVKKREKCANQRHELSVQRWRNK